MFNEKKWVEYREYNNLIMDVKSYVKKDKITPKDLFSFFKHLQHKTLIFYRLSRFIRIPIIRRIFNFLHKNLELKSNVILVGGLECPIFHQLK